MELGFWRLACAYSVMNRGPNSSSVGLTLSDLSVFPFTSYEEVGLPILPPSLSTLPRGKRRLQPLANHLSIRQPQLDVHLPSTVSVRPYFHAHRRFLPNDGARPSSMKASKSSSYLVSNAIVLPVSGWFATKF